MFVAGNIELQHMRMSSMPINLTQFSFLFNFPIRFWLTGYNHCEQQGRGYPKKEEKQRDSHNNDIYLAINVGLFGSKRVSNKHS
jgi:hypothetical protein